MDFIITVPLIFDDLIPDRVVMPGYVGGDIVWGQRVGGVNPDPIPNPDGPAWIKAQVDKAALQILAAVRRQITGIPLLIRQAQQAQRNADQIALGTAGRTSGLTAFPVSVRIHLLCPEDFTTDLAIQARTKLFNLASTFEVKLQAQVDGFLAKAQQAQLNADNTPPVASISHGSVHSRIFLMELFR